MVGLNGFSTKYFIQVIAGLLAFGFIQLPVYAQGGAFHAGALIPEYGKIADIDGMQALAKNAQYKVSFDVSEQADVGTLNRSFTSGARFLNMHVANGVKADHIKLAFVVHGKAVLDVTSEEFYENKEVDDNANAALIAQLIKHGVDIYVCGQSAVYQGVSTADLLPGVKMSLSAMTAHAELQQAGYTYNPF